MRAGEGTTTKPDQLPDAFDRALAMLDGRPDVVHTKAATHTAMPVLGIGGSTTFVVQTWSERAADGSTKTTVFLQAFGGDGHQRIVIPAPVCDTIARQRDAVSTKRRVIAGKRNAAERAARGELPGFMKKRGTRAAKKGTK